MATPPIPQRINLGLDPEVRAALARSAGDHHRPVAYEAEHLVVEGLVANGYLERGAVQAEDTKAPKVAMR